MIAIAPAVLFGAVAWLQLRNPRLSGLDAAIVFLFTLFFVQTGIGHAVSDWIGTLLGTHSGGGDAGFPGLAAGVGADRRVRLSGVSGGAVDHAGCGDW